MSNPAVIEQLDSGIDVLFANPDGSVPNVDSSVAELLGIAAELRTLPSANFRSQLRASLMEHAQGASLLGSCEVTASRVILDTRALQTRVRPVEQQILPTLVGVGFSSNGTRRSNFAISLFAHAVALMLVLTSGLWIERHPEGRVQSVTLVEPREYLALDNATTSTAGGGGSGDHDKLSVSPGHLPSRSLDQLAPPEVVIRNDHPTMTAEPSVVVPPRLDLANSRLPNLGDPKAPVSGPASNGTGAGGAIGGGIGLGVGAGFGNGVGQGDGYGYGGGVFRVGGGVSAPRATYKPDPEYSPEARQAKYQGTVVLSLVVAPDGKAHGLRVVRSLGMGLDEKAIEAVRQWRFEPARKDGKPVAVAIDVEVNFRLF